MMSNTTLSPTTTWAGDSTPAYTASSGYCPRCITWYWGDHHCHAALCGSHDHDFKQARSPYERTLFCRKCGETKQLKERRNGKPNV